MNSYGQRLVRKEQVKQLYTLAPLGFAATLVNSIIVFVVMKQDAPQRPLVLWLAAVLTITSLRAALVFRFRQVDLDRDPDRAAVWSRRFVASLFLVGLAWGSIAFLPFSFSLAHQVFLAFVLGGMAAGASSTFSQVKWGFLAFSAPALTPLALHFMLINDSFHVAMTLMILLFLLLLWRISRHNYEVNRTSLVLRFEKEEVIQSLRKAKDDIEGLYHQLKNQIAAKEGAEAELRQYQERLEQTVKERTADLVAANQQLKNEIEERARIESALLESRERLDLAQKAGRVGVFDWDPVSNRVIWTSQLEELFGLQQGQFEGTYQAWARRLDPADLTELENWLRERMAQRATQLDFEYRFRHATGELRWMSASGRVTYLADGNPARVIGTNVDVTDLKEAREKLTAAKNAAEAGNQTKSEFLANMSHEMRTPLAGTLGMIRLVLDMDINEEERQLLEMAGRSAESLLRLIGDVLDFSRLEAGEMTFERTVFSVAEAVRTAVEVVSLHAAEKGIQLDWQVDDELAQVEGDQGRLRQVLVNLLGNAVKFTEQGGVSVRASLWCDPETPGGRRFVQFSVRDTGIGIPAGELERIFGKFNQIDTSLTRKYGGTGLGLALSRQIVEKLGGRIWAESSPGGGSTFYFTLPMEPSGAPTA